MFYRYMPDGRRKSVDLEGLYRGPLFLCGGHPSLREVDFNLFRLPGITTMAMNNTATLFKPTLWVCADRPSCYSRSILRDPSVLKFARLVFQGERIGPSAAWRDMPATLFYGASDKGFTRHNLLCARPELAFWKNVFIIAVQLSYRLGFRRIYLCGCGFQISPDAKYAYASALTAQQVAANQRCYNSALGQVVEALSHFHEYGLELVSCTPGSALNEHIRYVAVEEAVDLVWRNHPMHDTVAVWHSSEASKHA